MSTTDRPEESPQLTVDSPTPAGHRRRPRSIKRQVTRVVLIPTITLIVLWFVASGILVFNGFYDREVASSVQQVSIPAVQGLAALQKERSLSIAHLARPSAGLQDLLAQQQQSAGQLAEMRSAANSMMSSAPDSIVHSYRTLTGYLDQLPKIRGEIDAGATSEQQVFTFYNNLIDAATSLFDTQARVVPDVTATQGALGAVQLFRISDHMSRSGSLMSGAFASGSLDEATFDQFTSLVGGYHTDLAEVVPDARPDVQASYRQLTASPSWQGFVAAENAVISHGPWIHGVPEGLGLASSDWDQLVDQNFAALTQMTITQADQVSAEALDDGTQQLLNAGIGSVVALGIAVLAILWARRQSRTLVDRTLVTRLAKLRTEARELVDIRLPNIVGRLKNGQAVDVRAELPDLQFGQDEIGQVATAFNQAQRAAVDATVQEARARHGLNRLFLGIARRNQGPLHTILNHLEKWENTADPDLLERLFTIDHPATQARRNVENLIILGGGQLSHRAQNSPVLEMLRAATGETGELKRIDQRIELRVSDKEGEVVVAGGAVIRIVHLLSELMDNALKFSPPHSPVKVSCTPVPQGLMVEIDDQGLGMEEAQREQANQMFREPPAIDAIALEDGSRLGFWVIAQISSQLGIVVELRESPYGGMRALVRIPNKVLVSKDGEPVVARDAEVAPPAQSGVQPQIKSGIPPETPAETTMDFGAALSAVTASDAAVPGADLTPPRQPAATRPSAPAGFGSAVRRIPGAGMGTVTAAMPRHAAAEEHMRPASTPLSTGRPVPPTPDQEPGEPRKRPPLPQRQPQEHIVPQLREPEDDAGTGQPADSIARSPESPGADLVRDRLTAFQAGTVRGRADDPMNPADPDDGSRTS